MTLAHAVSPDLESVAGAQRRLLDGVGVLAPERVTLEDALGRILAEAVSSQSDLPGFDNSAMDGYAVRASDISGATAMAPNRLPVVGESRAGTMPIALEPGTAMRIMTGAPMPAGADTVVRQEDTSRDGSAVLIQVATAKGTSVRWRGGDMDAGTTVLQPGMDLTSIDIAVAAALGNAHLIVGARPRVSLLATGDELVAAGTAVGPAQLVDSNSPMLTAAVREAGGIPTFLGIGGDSKESLRTLLQTGAAGADLIVSSAGVSVGDHDWVREVVSELGTISTWRVAMRPGKPVLTGTIGDAVFIGLPGNPVSSSVTFELFARPVIRKMQGARALHRRRMQVRLGEDMAKPEALETYARAVLQQTAGELPSATSSGDQGSSMLQSLTRADCLVVLPVGLEVVPAGTVVEAIPLR
jgi:molybdopterin molybdotransferase